MATVGKNRAPQNVLVTETGSADAGRDAAAELPSRAGSMENTGSTHRAIVTRGTYFRSV